MTATVHPTHPEETAVQDTAVFDRIIDPTVGPPGDARSRTALAPRPGDLSGLRLGLLVNTKRNAAEFVEEVTSVLSSQHGMTPVMTRTKPSIVHPAPDEMVAELREACDVVVVGVGDCGSCSASAIADGLQLEKAGVPTVVVVSDAFRVSADAMAELQGTTGYQYVTTPHPVANLSREGLRDRAAAATPEIVALLTGPAPR
ncbi:UGSC family (seleno)protein [Modestobacter versicolor]|uniref:UGSC family (seleno)protein n=1 Tax=Modestobacter versicolor TaxID=429133 RepID=UPI0034DEEF59